MWAAAVAQTGSEGTQSVLDGHSGPTRPLQCAGRTAAETRRQLSERRALRGEADANVPTAPGQTSTPGTALSTGRRQGSSPSTQGLRVQQEGPHLWGRPQLLAGT